MSFSGLIMSRCKCTCFVIQIFENYEKRNFSRKSSYNMHLFQDMPLTNRGSENVLISA